MYYVHLFNKIYSDILVDPLVDSGDYTPITSSSTTSRSPGWCTGRSTCRKEGTKVGDSHQLIVPSPAAFCLLPSTSPLPLNSMLFILSSFLLSPTLLLSYYYIVDPFTPTFMSSSSWDAANFDAWIDDLDWDEVTDVDTWKNDEVISHLTRDPMVRDLHLQSAPVRNHRHLLIRPPYVLGDLSRLPPELVDHILGLLDPVSLQTFGRTSFHSLFVAAQQSEYGLLQRVAPTIIPLLQLTGLSYLHSIHTVCQELRFPHCRSCGGRGTLLCLPTCERICENCAELNQAYWGLYLSEAKTAFALDDLDLDPLPILLTNARIWRGAEPDPIKRDAEFITVKTALTAGLQKWGSIQNLTAAAERISPDRHPEAGVLDIARARLYRFLRKAQIYPLISDPSQTRQTAPNPPSSLHPGMVTTLFPTVPSGRSIPLPLYRCNGCWIICRAPYQIADDHFDLMEIDPIDNSDEDKTRMIRGRMFMAQTLDELRDHITHECLGAKLLMFRRHILNRDRKKKEQSEKLTVGDLEISTDVTM